MISLQPSVVTANLLHCKGTLNDKISQKPPEIQGIWSLSVSFKEIYVISECHEHPCCHLFSVPLHFFQDISCRKFSNSLFLTQPESAKYQYFWWQLSVKLYDYLACISLKIVSCLLTWHVHFFAYIFKRELY